MSALDHMTDDDVKAAGEGVILLMAIAHAAGLKLSQIPGMSKRRRRALAALIPGAPDDAFAEAKAEDN